jgi:hypothetical protein
MRRASVSHEFVEFIPSELDEGVVYVSMPYATAVHRCACGCGNRVVTPISPAQWRLMYDGESISLTPSIGNWQFPCRSHYWISHNRIRWSGQWTAEEIAAGRLRDAQDLEDYFAGRSAGSDSATTPVHQSDRGILHRVLRLLRLR